MNIFVLRHLYHLLCLLHTLEFLLKSANNPYKQQEKCFAIQAKLAPLFEYLSNSITSL